MTNDLKVRYATEEELPVGDFWRLGSLSCDFYHSKFDPKDIPESIDIPIYLNYGIGSSNYGKINFYHTDVYLNNAADSQNKMLNLAKLVVTVPLPKVNKDDCIVYLVEALKEEKNKILAETQMRVTEIDDKLKNLLAITYDPVKTTIGET